jgi:hypothetical protein
MFETKQDELTEAVVVAPVAADERPAFHIIINARNSRTSRTARAMSSTRSRSSQFVGGDQIRVVRSRPREVTKSWLMANIDEVRQKVQQGILDVKSLDGRSVNLDTFEIAPPIIVIPPTPQPREDTVANDTPSLGGAVPQYPDGTSLVDVLRKAQQEAISDEHGSSDEDDEDAEVEHSPTPQTSKPQQTQHHHQGKKRGR